MKTRRLSKQEWIQIKQLFIAGWSQGQLAKHFGIPLGTIADHCAVEKWSRWRPEVMLQEQL